MWRNEARGEGVDDTGSGGGIALLSSPGEVSHNTIVYNLGGGESSCSGGGILLFQTDASLLSVHSNIVAFNQGCGLLCRWQGRAAFGQNLFWANDQDIGDSPESCPHEWDVIQIFADPRFCISEQGDFRVAEGSPAVTLEGVMGAFPSTGCSPTVPTNGSYRRRLTSR